MKTFQLELESYLKISEEKPHLSILKHEKTAYLISGCKFALDSFRKPMLQRIMRDLV
jgi:hypothetical protein